MSELTNSLEVRIEPWADDSHALLRRLNAPEMMKHLGGPESEDKILARHKRYLNLHGKGCMFSIELLQELEPVGSVGYWESDWQDETVFEIGWSVLPSFQGRGIASAAVAAAVTRACSEKKHKYIYAFPSVNNPASNAICRKLDFMFNGEDDFEYPPGNMMRCSVWRLDLTTTR
ncbi:GNAT family N-acetyltransferase [Bacillus sp. PAMC26568]|nr:GNAT family N-acetyltransferase [Bacillus sp. PAMC26568]